MVGCVCVFVCLCLSVSLSLCLCVSVCVCLCAHCCGRAFTSSHYRAHRYAKHIGTEEAFESETLSDNQMLMYRATENYRASNQEGDHPVVLCDAVAAAIYLDERLIRKSTHCRMDVETSGASRGASLLDWPYRRHEADSSTSASGSSSPASEPTVRVVEQLDHSLYTSMLERALSK
jgi:inosine-uridine nucleoside N-ribohydrolase